MADEEFPVDDDYGMTAPEEPVDQVIRGVITTGAEDGALDDEDPGAPAVEAFTPVGSWAEVDPAYEELVDEDADRDDVEDDLIPAGDVDTSEDEDTPFQGVGWAFYEIEGRSFDRDGAWQPLAREQFTGALDARIDGLPAGERWEFRVRLVDHDGIASAWSETTLDQLPVDETPPPAPTAPLWDQNNGFLTYGWDGSLVAPTPEDMSHTLAYVRQLHPAGNPQGPAGDPRLLARFMQEGYQSTGSLVADVPHELWLVAVDTTGNGSQWSEVVEFTPSEPVDAQRIRDELDTLDARVGEGFEESLTEAIAGADHRIERLAVGELFAENAIKAPSIDVQDLAANVGRMNELWAGFAGISEAQIITLLGDTATFKTINAPLIQSHTDPDIGWKLRPDGTAMMREADVRGRFQAGTGSSRAEIDQGNITYYSPVDGANRTLRQVPYLRFSTPNSAGGATEPLIAAKPTGGLVLGSGRNSPEFGRSVVEIDGHLNALGADFTSHMNTTSVYASIGITGIGSNPTQLGGIVADGARTRLQGRTPDSHNARDMYVRGVSTAFSLPNSDSVQRINFTYGEPVPTGDRLPFVTCSTQLADNTNGRMATVGVGNISASGFQGVARNAGGGSPVSYNMLYNALWR